ncbi:hypothetical protein B484DRAFT_440987, partial [Ochromonadaceae sp. CCMP2298]
MVALRNDEARPRIPNATAHPDRDFLSLGPKDDKNQTTPPLGIHFAPSRRGELRYDGLQNLSPKSTSFALPILLALRNFLAGLVFTHSENTVRQKSLGKSELVDLHTRSDNISSGVYKAP